MSDLSIHKETKLNIIEALQQNDAAELLILLDELYAEDIAELFEDLDIHQMQSILGVLAKEDAIKVWKSLEEEICTKLLSSYDTNFLAINYFDYFESDDAVDILSLLSPKKASEVIENMTDTDLAKNIISLLKYKDDTAGGLMAKELIRVNLNWTLNDCVSEIRKQAEEIEVVHNVYVVDDKNRLKGVVALKSIILEPAHTLIENIYNPDVISVRTHTSGEEVANIMNKYDLVSIPVVDPIGRLLGRVTLDDIVDFIKEESDKDYQLMSGISEDVDAQDKIWVQSRARLPWLLVGLVGGVFSSRVVGMYEGELAIFPQMAFFMPLVAAMGGNAGVQSSAIVVQGLANHTLKTSSILPKLGKEFFVALLNGLICAVLIWMYNSYINHDSHLGLTVSIALLTVIIFASILGMLVPLLLNRFKVDPALATGPFITTTNDLIGLSVYFIVGNLILN